MSTKKFSTLICAIVIAVLLGGCAGVPKQAFNKEANHELKVIGLLEPACPEKYFVQNLGHIGTGFGLIGGLIAAADMSSKTNKFDELMKVRNFRVAEEFEGLLTAELEKVGYSVKVIKPHREKPAFLEDYKSLDKDVDAYLDLSIGAGYMCASSTADYIPNLRTYVRLVRRGSNEILYADVISYGYELRAAKAVSIAAGQQYFFKDFGALTSNPDLALEGLREGMPLVVARIVHDLSQ